MLPLDPSEKAWHMRMQGPPIQEGVRCCVSGSLTDVLVVNVTPVQSTCSTRPQDISSPVFRTDLHSTAHLPQTALPPLGSCYFWNLLPFQACAFIIPASATVLDQISLHGFLPNSPISSKFGHVLTLVYHIFQHCSA